jgi:hypothetical protein
MDPFWSWLDSVGRFFFLFSFFSPWLRLWLCAPSIDSSYLGRLGGYLFLAKKLQSIHPLQNCNATTDARPIHPFLFSLSFINRSLAFLQANYYTSSMIFILLLATLIHPFILMNLMLVIIPKQQTCLLLPN